MIEIVVIQFNFNYVVLLVEPESLSILKSQLKIGAGPAR